MPNHTAEIIELPRREKSLDPLRESIWSLERHELSQAAGNLVRLASEAADAGADGDFYDRTRAAYLCLERVLVEKAVAR